VVDYYASDVLLEKF